MPVAHQARTRAKAPMASATRAQASASPTVMRSASRQLVARDLAHDDPGGAQRPVAGLRLGAVAEAGQHEVRLRRIGRHARRGQRRGQRRAVAGVLRQAEGGVVRVPDRRLGGRELGRGEVERPPHPVQHVDDVPRPVAPADAQAAEPVDLREGPRHHHVVARLDQAGVAVEAGDEFGIGAVEHEERARRQAGGEARHLRGRDHRAGRVVGIGDEDERRALGRGGEDRVHVGPARRAPAPRPASPRPPAR